MDTCYRLFFPWLDMDFSENSSFNENYFDSCPNSISILNGIKNLSINALLESTINAVLEDLLPPDYKEKIYIIEKSDEKMEHLAADILIPIVIYLRDKIPAETKNFIELARINPVTNSISNYENYYKTFKNLPNLLMRLFTIDSTKRNYLINTPYPQLLLSIIKNANCSPFSINEKTRTSFKLNKRFFASCMQDLSMQGLTDEDIEKQKYIIIEEYFLFERIFNLHARLELFSEYFISPLKSTCKPTLNSYINKVQYMPNIYHRISYIKMLKDKIENNDSDINDCMKWIDYMAYGVIPYCQNVILNYINKRISDNGKSCISTLINEITHSGVYTKYCINAFPKINQDYDFSVRQGIAYSELVTSWDLIDVFKDSGEKWWIPYWKYYNDLNL